MRSSMNAYIIIIGSEITEGDIVDINSQWLEKSLIPFGIKVMSTITIPDDLSIMEKTIQNHLDYSGLLFICGGLGPTQDDITLESLSRALGKPLVHSEKAKQCIIDLLEKLNKYDVPIPEKMMLSFEEADVLCNTAGTAPGHHIRYNELEIFVLPGVPRELKAIFKDHIVSQLPKANQFTLIPRYYLITRTPESIVEKQLMNNLAPPVPSLYVITSSVEGVKIKFWLENNQNVFKQVDDFMKKVYQDNLSDYGEEISLIRKTSVLLQKYHQSTGFTISCAESCSGGLFAKFLTDIPGSSAYFLGGMVSYSNKMKIELLKIREENLAREGAVSEIVAKQMAENIMQLTGTTFSISFTGIAGPEGGTKEKPVGTVWIAWKWIGEETQSKRFVFYGNRDDIRNRSAYTGLDIVKREILSRIVLGND